MAKFIFMPGMTCRPHPSLLSIQCILVIMKNVINYCHHSNEIEISFYLNILYSPSQIQISRLYNNV